MKELRDVVQYARDHDWTVEDKGAGLVWRPPDRSRPVVHTPNRANHGRDINNILSKLRASGLPDHRTQLVRKRAASPDPAAAPADEEGHAMPSNGVPAAALAVDATSTAPFAASIAELIDQEFQARLQALLREVREARAEAADLAEQNKRLSKHNDQLREEVAVVRQELATAQSLEERIRSEARTEMEAALERVLKGSRLR